jgi:hypothetical protein
LRFKQIGFQKFLLDKHNDVIKTSKMDVVACNLILGNMYVDMDGSIEGINETTGDKLIVQFTPTSWKSNGRISGKVSDASGKVHWKIEGV